MAFLAPVLGAAIPSILGGIFGGGANGVMNGGNAALSGMLSANDTFQMGLMGQEMFAQDQLDAQATAFDEAMDQQSENMREVNSLRDAQMAQRKADDQITKKFIQTIAE
jgi:hypothetical protein